MKAVVINGIEYVPLIKVVEQPNNVNHYEKLILKSNIFKSKKP